MAARFISDPARVYAFCSEYIPLQMTAGMKGLGLERDGELIVGVVYEGYSGPNVWMHVAAKPGVIWAKPEALDYFFYYPFVEMGCSRVSGYVEASNEKSLKFQKHLGFKQEAVLKGAATDGGDVIVNVMWREESRYGKR